jgi:hypothetical protein
MDVLTFYLNDTAPAIRRRLSIQGEGDLDITVGPTFRLRVRPLWSSTLAVRGRDDGRRRSSTS